MMSPKNERHAIQTLFSCRALVHVDVMHEVNVVEYRHHAERLKIQGVIELNLR